MENLYKNFPDTITNSDAFERNPPAGFDGIVHWEAISRALPRNITPMDIDAVVELCGNFVMFETKENKRHVPDGQKMTIVNLVAAGKGKITFALTTKDLKDCQDVFVIFYKNSIVKSHIIRNIMPEELIIRWMGKVERGKADYSFSESKKIFEKWER